jgi:hypothetical protein
MAVQDGYGKVSGSESLVFAYDLKDTINSYRGEPTTNLAVSPLNITSGFSSAAGISRTQPNLLNFNGEYSAGLISRDGGGGWTAYTGGVSGTASGVKFTTTWYLKAGTATTVFVNWGGAHTGNRTDFAVDLLNGTVSDITLASGEFYEVESAPNGFYRIMYSSTLTSTTYFPQISPIASTGTIIFGGIQIERNSHATPFTSSSRSTTEGLLNLMGSGNVDISAVSYNSDAQMTFDGTSDVIYSPNLPQLDTFTLEVILKPSVVGGWFMYRNTNMNYTDNSDNFIFGFGNGKLFGGVEYHPTGDDVTVTGTSNIIVNEYVHGVLVHDNTTLTLQLYVNGVLENTTVSTNQSYPYRSTNKVSIGADGGSDHGGISGNKYFYNGEIPIVKIYNRVLTSTEVSNNYLKYKRQYGLT